MGRRFFFFLLVLLAAAIFLVEDFVFVLLYLFLGVYLVGRWWGARSLSGVSARRDFERRAFLGERVQVRLRIENASRLPLAWLQVRESLPVGLGAGGPFQRLAPLGPRGSLELDYTLDCQKRGYYQLGPLALFSGDVLGAAPVQQLSVEPDYLTVFPRIIPLSHVSLPSHSPLGTLRHMQPVFEDPSRARGKREYVTGDSLRRVDWKASAASGRLQVKLFEPSIALQTVLFLDLNARAYSLRGRFDLAELAIVAAASLASWLVSARQAVGLATNGGDPLLENAPPPPLPPRHGRAHLLRLLETLARLQAAETCPLAQLLQEQTSGLSWGATLVVITHQIDEAVFDSLFQLRRAGMSASLIQIGLSAGYQEARAKAHSFGFPIHQALDERDLQRWRR